MKMPPMPTRTAAAQELVEILDTPFLRALSESARLEVLKVMLVHGGGDVGSIAQHLPQDRSVVSRHLQVLEDAGIVSSTWQGRHRRYELNGSGFVDGFEDIAARVRDLARLCCPSAAAAKPASGATARRRRTA